jgi:hypothetical protein
VSGRPLALGGIVTGALGVAAAVTCLYLPMRDVMVSNGGYCASGGPYAIAPGHQCDGGSVWLMVVAPWVGLLLAWLLIEASDSWSGGRISGVGTLLWFALFGALGWNFLDLGINPPGPGSGAGWIVCGVVFWLMALGGLYAAALGLRQYFFPKVEDDRRTQYAPIVRAAVRPTTSTPLPGTTLGTTTATPSVAPAGTTTPTLASVGSPSLWLLATVAGSGVGVLVGAAIVHAA